MQLPKNREYNYINPKNKGKIQIVSAAEPEGPIQIRRYDPSRGESIHDAQDASISASQLRRYAAAFQPGIPVNVDRVLGGSYNTRSVLETLLAHCPQFYVCQPGRIEIAASSQQIKKGHKHLIWVPDEPHQFALVAHRDVNVVISEIPSVDAVYEAIAIPDQLDTVTQPGSSPDIARRHAQIQVALVKIGQQLGFRTWVARNDQGISYQGTRLGEMEGVVGRLEDERMISSFDNAIQAALLIDCIWFKNGRLLPAVIEIEHTTGVTSGLTRMQRLQMILPPFSTRWVIAAPDEDRDKVLHECNREQFRTLNAQFFPYSAVDELYSLCQRRKIRGVSEDFLDSFMEHALHIQ